jgi:hypothetical protein
MKIKVLKISFKEKVLGVVRNIPKGKTMTYKEVAKKAGNINASRAVGNFMKSNYDKTVPRPPGIKIPFPKEGYSNAPIGAFL